MTAESVVRTEGLTKAYGERVAVDGVGFHIDAGETYGLLGPNGAGKTTTISLVCGLLRADAGEVAVAGLPMRPDAVAAKAAIGLVPQEVALYDGLSAAENLRFFGRLQGLQGAELRDRVAEALAVVGLTDRAGDRIDEYSGGMKRRANIAAGLLHRPSLLVLDEPTVGVDPQSRRRRAAERPGPGGVGGGAGCDRHAGAPPTPGGGMTGADTGTSTAAGAQGAPGPPGAAGPRGDGAPRRRTGALGAVATIAGIYLRLAARDRVALFFVLVLPVTLITIIGSTVGGVPTVDVAVVDRDGSDASRELATTVDATERVDVEVVDDESALRRDVRTGSVSAGLVVPAGYGAALARGDDAVVRMVADPTSTSAAAVQATVRAAIGERAVVVAAGRAVAGDDPDDVAAATETAADVAGGVARSEVVTVPVGDDDGPELGAFDYTAPANLVLFTFVNTLVAGALLATDRRLGITHRMLATPHGTGTILAGIGASRLLFALAQSAIIVVVGAVVFGVDWGDPLGAALVVLLFALVATSVALFVGATVREPEQAPSVGTPVAIGLGMLGGCMWPLEIVPPVMQTVGHLTPQAWAMDAWIALIFDGAGVGGIVAELCVLAGFALVLGVLAARRLRRVLTR